MSWLLNYLCSGLLLGLKFSIELLHAIKRKCLRPNTGTMLFSFFIQRRSKQDLSEDRSGEKMNKSNVLQLTRGLQTASSTEGDVNTTNGFSGSPSHFFGAHDIVINGGIFTNIFGNSNTQRDQTLQSIVKGLRVFANEDFSLGQEICNLKGRGYRFYTARTSGNVVTMKVYQGINARDKMCKEAARFNQKFHPNILHIIGFSTPESDPAFLVFDGELQGAVDDMLGEFLKKGLKQSLTLGLQIVIGLSAGLGYLQDENYPFEYVPNLDHFILLSCAGKIMISFDSEAMHHTSQGDEQFSCASEIFPRLCKKTFDAAGKAHYENQQTRDTFIDELETADSEDEAQNEDVENPVQVHESARGGKLPSTSNAQRRSSKRSTQSGLRREIVWKHELTKEIRLDDISCDFQSLLYSANSSNSEPPLSRRRGRYTARTFHRCPGYNRVEITLTPDVSRSAIVSHASPIPHEICPVCKEVVKDAEVFNCVCGGEDNESMPTVKCSTCSEWHHRPCVVYVDLIPHAFLCGKCMAKQGQEEWKTQLMEGLVSLENMRSELKKDSDPNSYPQLPSPGPRDQDTSPLRGHQDYFPLPTNHPGITQPPFGASGTCTQNIDSFNVNNNNTVYNDESQTNYEVRFATENGRSRQRTAHAAPMDQPPAQRRQQNKPYPAAKPRQAFPTRSSTSPTIHDLTGYDPAAPSLALFGRGTSALLEPDDVQGLDPQAASHLRAFFAAQFPSQSDQGPQD